MLGPGLHRDLFAVLGTDRADIPHRERAGEEALVRTPRDTCPQDNAPEPGGMGAWAHEGALLYQGVVICLT